MLKRQAAEQEKIFACRSQNTYEEVFTVIHQHETQIRPEWLQSGRGTALPVAGEGVRQLEHPHAGGCKWLATLKNRLAGPSMPKFMHE